MEYLESIILDRTERSILMKSPAKINLCLRVLDERPDGYHNVENLMQTIDFCDEVEVRLQASPGVSVECGSELVPVGDDNIAVRAAKRFLEKCEVDAGVVIRIVKRIPLGGGLGGGSSNAGTVLLGLNELLGCVLERNVLLEIATDLGSDVPFFLYGGLALCRGKGDLVEPVESLPEYMVVLVNPGIVVSTERVYEIYKKKCLTLKRGSGNVLKCGGVKRLDDLASILRNDLEAAVEEVIPELRAIKRQFKASGCEHVMVTGSGSSLFGLCENRAHSGRVISGLRRFLIDTRFLLVEASSWLQQGGLNHV
jgi:4-diphosphocytidyl-2-C-methyl-D-erythritol kinase